VPRVRVWHAKVLHDRAGPGDAERARLFIAEARREASEIGMPLLQERLAQHMAGADGTGSVEAAGVASVKTPVPGISRVAAAPAFSLEREGDVWAIQSGSAVSRLRDSRGLQMLAELVASPGRELHVLALAGGDNDGTEGGDAGESLDAQAIAEYRERLENLADEKAEAESFGDAIRAARAEEERAAIARELAAGVGLGGRARRTGSAAERARVNVQRRIRGAIRKIGETHPALATYLDRTVITGTFCSYRPL
jgi:hypothetical protein